MKVADLIDNAGSIVQNGVENRAQFDEAMSLYGELVCQAAKAAAASKLLVELVKGIGALTAEYAIGHKAVFTEPLTEIKDGVKNGIVEVGETQYRLTVSLGDPKRISGSNMTQDFLKRLPETWCKSSLKLNVGALADVDEKTLAKHDIKRDEKGVWSLVERAA
jgi:hypothetical protein